MARMTKKAAKKEKAVKKIKKVQKRQDIKAVKGAKVKAANVRGVGATGEKSRKAKAVQGKTVKGKTTSVQSTKMKSVKGKIVSVQSSKGKSTKVKTMKSKKPVTASNPVKNQKTGKKHGALEKQKTGEFGKNSKSGNQASGGINQASGAANQVSASFALKQNDPSEKTYDIAILGATGAVGEAIIAILEERFFPVGKLYALASERSAGNSILFRGKPVIVEEAEDFDFSKVQIALFSAGGEVSKRYAPIAAKASCIVIDNTSAFRLDPSVPLVIPEVNPEAIADYHKKNIIANPNCSTIQMLVALKPIYDAVGIERINVATYQSVSGTGRAAITELAEQVTSLLNGKTPEINVYTRQIAFNVIPHCGSSFQENGYSQEEMKMLLETQKIFSDPNIKVNATTVRVPVFYGHSEAIHLETERKITAEEARKLLSVAPGIIVMDDPKNEEYPTPRDEASDTDAVYVGRIRQDISHPRGLNLWVVSDNLRKGAALNAVQIAELLVQDYL